VGRLMLPGSDRRLVSCLMVTMASRWRDGVPVGAQGYQAQRHEPRELILVTADPHPRMLAWAERLSSVTVVQHLDPAATVGALRQMALDSAAGDFVATWDDDDVNAPDRLAVQLEAFEAIPDAEACMLTRLRVRDEVGGRPDFISPRMAWPQTLVGRRESMPAYEDTSRGEDSIFCQRLNRVVLLDRPDLYTYRVHPGSSTAVKMAPTWWNGRTGEVTP